MNVNFSQNSMIDYVPYYMLKGTNSVRKGKTCIGKRFGNMSRKSGTEMYVNEGMNRRKREKSIASTLTDDDRDHR